jgi:diguanylate cyclase (GGDEF)-like protein
MIRRTIQAAWSYCSQKWISFTVPEPPDSNSLFDQVTYHKHILFSGLLFTTIIFDSCVIILDSFSDILDYLFLMGLLLALTLNKKRRLQAASLAYLGDLLVIPNYGLWHIPDPRSVLWNWLLMPIAIVFASYFLPSKYVYPAAIGEICIILLRYLGDPASLSYISTNEMIYFALYVSILFMGLAYISSYYVSVVQNVMRQADHAEELAEANKRLQNTYRELHNTHQKLTDAYRQVEQQATIDPITELANHRYLMEYLTELASKIEHFPLSVVFIDIDHFKSVNDTWGHRVGDSILRNVAVIISAVMSSTLRIPDQRAMVGRYGGEEFVVILPGTPSIDAYEIADTARLAIQNYTYTTNTNKEVKVTISGGVATMPEHATELSTLLEIADAAMYEVKHSGRNRIELARKALAA